MDLLGKWCLVTGGASGIGRATAEALLAEGARLILCDIDRARMDEVGRALGSGGAEVLTYGLDVAKEDEVAAFASWVMEEVGVPDVVVNNAGILVVGGYAETSLAQYRRVIDVNLLGTVAVTKQFAPRMAERGSGAIVNVASASGRVGFSELCAYSTSKFGVVGFSQALRAELSESGVSVTVVCPGFVKTEIARHSGLREEEIQAVARVLEERGMTPDKVAEVIVRAARSGSPLFSVGGDARAMEWLGRLLPAQASSLVRRYIKRKSST